MGSSSVDWDHTDPFYIEITVQPDDIDGFGHVNNAVYLRWLTECAWAHSAAVGLPEEACVQLRRGMAVRSIQVDILASAYLDDELLVGNWLTDRDRLRATRIYQIVNPATGMTLLRGRREIRMRQPRQRPPGTYAAGIRRRLRGDAAFRQIAGIGSADA